MDKATAGFLLPDDSSTCCAKALFLRRKAKIKIHPGAGVPLGLYLRSTSSPVPPDTSALRG